MCHKMQFNWYTMTGKTADDIDMLLASRWDDLELIIDENMVVTDISGEFVAIGKIVGIGNGICC